MIRVLRRASAFVAGLALALVIVPTTAAAAPAPAPAPLGIIVKIGQRAPNPLGVLGALLPSLRLVLDPLGGASTSGLFLVRPADPAVAANPTLLGLLAKRLTASPQVEYAEPNRPDGLLDGLGLHAWPDGAPSVVGTDTALWSGQPAAGALRLGAAHSVSTGRGITVAVLDTGVDARHPALAGKVLTGYDYLDGDADTSDTATGSDSSGNGVPDEAVGHGTVVAGTVGLVAPDARILPYRVLDSDGTGTTYAAASAIFAATKAGARVINLSFGLTDGTSSRALADAVAYATGRGIVVVAAAGNTGRAVKTYPAALPGVLSVSALASSGSALATFSTFGSWVKVAAPGQDVVGPVPGGGFARWSGTSIAAPIVAGQAALVRARLLLGLTSTVTNAVTATTSKLPSGAVKYGAVDVVDSLNPVAGLLPPVGLGLLGFGR